MTDMTILSAADAADKLMAAAKVFAARTDSFAFGKAETCRDIAAKVARFGGFASAKQAEFAGKLVSWAAPAAAPAAAVPSVVDMPKTAAAVNGFAKVTIGAVAFTRNNSGARWVLWNDALVGRLENGTVKLFESRAAKAGVKIAAIVAELTTIEADPAKAITDHGKVTGVCGCCGRTLTDPASVEAGIGPVCAKKFGIK